MPPTMATEPASGHQKRQQGKTCMQSALNGENCVHLEYFWPRTQEELKPIQKQLVAQLQAQLHVSLGPPLHPCLGQAFVALYAVGDTFSLHDTLGKCCDVVKMKEETAAGPSNNKL